MTEGVTENLRKVTSYAAKHEARFMKLLTEQTEDGSKRRGKLRRQEIEIYYSFVGKVELPD